MADTYGTFTFTMSKDAVINECSLVKALNNFVWEFSGGRWVHDEEDSGIYFSEHPVQFPTVDPQMIKTANCFCYESETDYTKSLEEMTAEDWDCFQDYECEDCDLTDIKAHLSKEVEVGWFEIAFTSNEKQHFVACGSIRVEANEIVTRRYTTSGDLCGSRHYEETA